MSKIKIFVTLLIGLLLPGFQAIADEIDYSDNIGFMKDVPTEWREMYPECDEFLNVEWVYKKIPPGKKKSIPRDVREGWTGIGLLDVHNKYGEKQQYVLFASPKNWLFLVDRDKYDLVKEKTDYTEINTSDHPFMAYLLVKNRDDAGSSRHIGQLWRRPHRYYGMTPQGVGVNPPEFKFSKFYGTTIANNTKSICLFIPKNSFISQNNIIYMIEKNTSFLTDKNKYNSESILDNLLELVFNNDTSNNKNNKLLMKYLLSGEHVDTDNDGKKDYVFLNKNTNKLTIYFYNEENRFIMQYPDKCYDGLSSMYFYRYSKRISRQRCVANEKKIFIENGYK